MRASDAYDLRACLRSAGMRATRPRLALAALIFEAGHRHLTAEGLHREAAHTGTRLPLATVYNTLHRLTEAGLLQRIVVDARRSYFDTNTTPHYHFFDEDHGRLVDIPAEAVELSRLPEAPAGTEVESVDVIIRVRRTG
ncbi:iron response transcriptional regulator IrrA [Arhodomonas sp. AD133]|uniref:iron response transcriptional regulator IrrA n=1 Tax=Arhodomonas sp. AD133 TaxID=3415009 RepID=UPI003EB9DB53